MIELYYWGTVNGHKIAMYLEEYGLEYKITPVMLKRGDQFKPSFIAISPNNRMPAIVDWDPNGGGEPISVFESGAILLYLADKTSWGLSKDLRDRKTTLEWLMWQMSGLGPMAGQYNHFKNMARERLPAAIKRYRDETGRLLSVLDRHLEAKDFIASDYSIADMACFPLVKVFIAEFSDFSNLQAWCDRIDARPGTTRVYAHAEVFKRNPNMNDEEYSIMFNQNKDTVRELIQRHQGQ